MIDCVIIGGGLHGVHLAIAAKGSPRLDQPESLAILDPAPDLIQQWLDRTSRIGMTLMRSGLQQHLELPPESLRRFLGSSPRRGELGGRYQQPSLELFNRHCEAVIDRHRLRRAHQRCSLLGLQRRADGFLLTTSLGDLEARKVIVAIGCSPGPFWPDWAFLRPGGSTQHVFQSEALNLPPKGQALAVVGAGTSGGQLALKLCRDHPVTLYHRSALKIARLDADMSWLKPDRKGALRDDDEAAQAVMKARFEGSMTPELARQIEKARQLGNLTILQATESQMLACQEPMILATGFSPLQLPSWLWDYGRQRGLKLIARQWPKLDERLQWDENLFLTGPFAELKLGALARNIAGARLAAMRIAGHGASQTGRRAPPPPPTPYWKNARATRRWHGLDRRRSRA